MPLKTRIMLTAIAMIGISLLLLFGVNHISIQFVAKSNPTPPIDMEERIAQEYRDALDEIDAKLKEEGVRLIAIPREFRDGEDFVMDSLQRVLPMLLGALVLIVVTAALFTRVLARTITTPLDQLSQAAVRIQNGILDEPIDYRHKDEFGAVCHAFDQMQQSLLSAQIQAAATEQARTEMIAGISHDLRTPLTSVKGYIKGVQDGVAATPEKRAQYLDIAYRRASDMDVLLQRLFYISKVDAGALQLEHARVELGQLLSEFEEEVTPELALSGDELKVDVPPVPCFISLDYGQIHRVLSNLVENSLKYAGTQPVRMNLQLQDEGYQVRLVFSDNGNGVPDEQLDRLFDRFWRGDAARSSQNANGSGLGLYLARHIVKSHGGTIEVANRNGLTTTIILPRKENPNGENLDCGG